MSELNEPASHLAKNSRKKHEKMSTKTADITSSAKLTKLEFENSKLKGFHI